MKTANKILDWISKSPTQARRFLEAVANFLDLFRVVPRTVMFLYCYLLYTVTNWFMSLSDPTTQQSAFISVVFGAGAGLFGLYTGNNRNVHKITQEPPPPLVDKPAEEVAR